MRVADSRQDKIGSEKTLEEEEGLEIGGLCIGNVERRIRS